MTVKTGATYIAGAALGRYLRVKPGASANEVVVADKADAHIGTTRNTVQSGEPVAVRESQGHAITEMIAAAAIADNALVAAANGGKVTAESAAAIGDQLIGYARGAASADNDIIDVIEVLGLGKKA